MVLIAVLGILIFILSISYQVADTAIFQEQYFQRILNYQKAYFISKSAVDASRQLFAADDPKTDDLNELWAIQLPPLNIDDGIVLISLTDENRKFNINSISGKKSDEASGEYGFLKRLLKNHIMDQNTALSIYDWIGDDISKGSGSYFEINGNMIVPAKKALMDSVHELLFIKGITKEDFYDKVANKKKITGLKDLITVWGNAKININTASYDILMSLDEKMDEKIINQIISRRKEKPFKSLNDLLEINGMDLNIIYRLNNLCDVKSDVYRISVTVNMENDKYNFTYIVKRDAGDFNIIALFNE